MNNETKDTSIETLHEIRTIMERSSRFLSLSGWSGIWAGCTALVGAGIALKWLNPTFDSSHGLYYYLTEALYYSDKNILFHLIALGFSIFLIAFIGGIYFTQRKAKKDGQKLWGKASIQMIGQMATTLAIGAFMILFFIYDGAYQYVGPSCLIFYGLALINGSRYTLSDIRYLGFIEVMLGGINLFLPYYTILFWTTGFGVLHILYGIIMWNKYERKAV